MPAWVLIFGLILSNGQVEEHRDVYQPTTEGFVECATAAQDLAQLPEVKFARCTLGEVSPEDFWDDKQ